MAIDNRLFRGVNSQFESTASVPSLRSSEHTLVNVDFNNMASEDSSNVKVVVRVRQFIKRELEAKAQCIVRMNAVSQCTTVAPLVVPTLRPDSDKCKVKKDQEFTFDKSFWSHDPSSPHYSDQQCVYESFASDFLAHNFDGFNTCIFAYGQTGSGKSYTMMGTPEQPGVMPRYCKDLFRQIDEEPEENTSYNVHVSYLEIYNEHVRDLLAAKTKGRDNYLKIREHPTDGVYVQAINDERVESFEDIKRLMEFGDSNRTTGQTKMNDTSSRSHAVFTISLKQIKHNLQNDETIERTARMRLVDLAGSERANKTQAKGQRLKEGSNINQSLTTLGRVIAALAENSSNSTGGASGRNSPRPNSSRGRPGRSAAPSVIPYRDSVLTWLLKDSLGGNSKTAMVACISPSASDYDETLSTLRYADQAKKIRTRAVANIDAVSSAERDAQLAFMTETIRHLQLSVAQHSEKKKEEIDMLDTYQRQVEKMQRLMEETRQVSDAKIAALTAEVDFLAPRNQKMEEEIDALRRHLNLVTAELTNPIVIPPELHVVDGDGNDSQALSRFPSFHDDYEQENDPRVADDSRDSYSGVADEMIENQKARTPESLTANEVWFDGIGPILEDSETHQMLEELNLFRKKLQGDKDRFCVKVDKIKTKIEKRERKASAGGLGHRALRTLGMA